MSNLLYIVLIFFAVVFVIITVFVVAIIIKLIFTKPVKCPNCLNSTGLTISNDGKSIKCAVCGCNGELK